MPRIILDIETVPLDDAAEYIEPATAPANYKDPEKIAAYEADAKAKAVSRCALDVDLCRIVCAVWAEDEDITVSIARGESYERDLLAELARAVRRNSQIIGFNIFDFDLPVVIRRAQYLGVDFPSINLDRYRTPHLDLMERLSFNGKLKYRSLDFYCRRFGIDVPDAHSGKEVGALVQASDWDGVVAHCEADVRKVAALAQRLGILSEAVA